MAHLEKIVQYNVQSSDKEKFDGVMLDIEPYISDSWKENPEEYMDRYISCMKKGYKFAQKNHLRTAPRSAYTSIFLLCKAFTNFPVASTSVIPFVS